MKDRHPHFTTEEAAAYLGFKTKAGIRGLVYSGELVPDGRGYRGTYMFSRETLDGWYKVRERRRLERRYGGVPERLERPPSRSSEQALERIRAAVKKTEKRRG